MEFILNGKNVEYSGDPELSLLKYLRNEAGIISPKDGCSKQGTCGACSVQLEDRAVLSCVLPMKKVEGKTITTIEGWNDRQKGVFARAFLEKGGVQCGFCTPGIVVQAKVLLDKNPNPSREDIIKNLDKNICRCTGYKKIVESIKFAAKLMRGDTEIIQPSSLGKIGDRHPKYEGYELVLGQKLFVEDMKFEDMHFAAFKFSDHPRARVLSINTDEAEKLNGVKGVFTEKDIPGDRIIGLIAKDWPCMIKEGEETRYIGDVLAGVVAESEEIARQAAGLIKVDYEVLQPVCDPFEAMKEGSPLVHAGGNILEISEVKRGDIEKALQEAAFVSKGTYKTQRIEHAFLEKEACIAKPWQFKGEAGIEVFSQGQGVYEDRRQIAQLLNLPQERVNVHQVSNGGGFGGKEDMIIQGQTALFAFLLNVPVKLSLTRPESMRMHPKRHPMTMDYEVGCDSDGNLTVIRAQVVGDTGAYASVGGKVVERAVGHATGAYHIPVAAIKGYTVYTNNIPCGAMRGFGANQAHFAMESCVDDLCEQGNFDRWKFRYNNALTAGRMTSTGQILEGGVGVRASLEAVKEEFYKAKYAGLACGIKNTGIGNGMNDESTAKIVIESEKKVVIHHGWTEMGQGLSTVALQTLCQETGIAPDIIEVKVETQEEAPAGMTTASRGTSLLGNAIIDACKELKEDLKNKSLKELSGKVYRGKWVCDWTTKPSLEDSQPVTHYSYGYAAQVVVLDDNGKIAVVYAAHDAGKIINPNLYEGQIEGAVHMGVGYAITEDYPLKDGVPEHFKLGKLGILKARHTPDVVVKGVEVPDPHGPYGAKGVGEIGLVPTAGAVANALYQFDKKRRYTLPLKVEYLIKGK
ncbi:selenium-dependent xanthine dehydrogenase [Candidatus Riflebacteria bacterium]